MMLTCEGHSGTKRLHMGARLTLCAALLIAAFLAWAPDARAADKSYGAPLIDKGMRLEESDGRGSRFVSPRNYNETVKFYRKLWRGNDNIEFRKIANLPSVRAIHVLNKSPKSEWNGMNIYEHKGETKVFIIPRTKAPEKTPAK